MITITVTAENGDTRDYAIDIEKPTNTVSIVIIIIVLSIALIIGMKLLKKLFDSKNKKGSTYEYE